MFINAKSLLEIGGELIRNRVEGRLCESPEEQT